MSTAAATPAPASPPAPPPLADKLDDFSDKLSPMLVKELRQGLRAKTFVVVFLALQALLTFVLLITVSASSSTDAGHMVSSVIFLFYSFAVLVVQPLRGIGSLHNEIRGNTIDLMVLTRMGTWRIALGKWVAIVGQSALLLAAIAPYLILRYFFGRMELFAELLLLLLVFMGSAVFTALTVGLSALPSILVRGLFPLFLAVVLGFGICGVIFDGDLKDFISFCTLAEEGSGWTLLAGILAAAYAGWSALALGVSAIAPMAENHSTVRRLIALGSVLAAGVFAVAGKFQAGNLGMLLLAFCAPALVIALTEPMTLLPPVARPFLRFGGAGKLAGRVLYPGWASGVLFCGLLLLAAAGIFSAAGAVGNDRLNLAMVSVLGSFLFPAVVLRLFARRVKAPLAFYVLVLAITAAIAAGVLIATIETESDGFVWYFSWVPPVQLILGNVIETAHSRTAAATIAPPDFMSAIRLGLGVAIFSYLILLASAFMNFRVFREVEEEAAAKPETTP